MTDEPRIYLTVDQALSILSEDYHSFINKFGVVFGCDHSKEFIVDLLKNAEYIELAGDVAKSMCHGVAARKDNKDYFLKTDPEKLVKLELELLEKLNAKA